MGCIFCGDNANNSTKSHILPGSLGGEEWACLPDGIVCSKCNQYFGEKVERLALDSFPFLPFRLLIGIPTRKMRPPKMQTHLGTFKGSPFPGVLGLDPASLEIDERVHIGEVNQIRILAEPIEPEAVCRMLVKMGLEVVANDSLSDAKSAAFDAARNFARRPNRNTEWWFLVHTDHESLFSKFQNGVSIQDWESNVSMSVVPATGAEIFRLQLLDITIITPLHDSVLPPSMDSLPEPEYRLFQVNV